MRVAFLEARPGDPHERRQLHIVDRRRPAIAHRLPEAADELVEDVRDRALVRDTPLDALGDKLVDVFDVALEVAVLREAASLHRAERAHASVLLESLAAGQDD